MVNQVPLVSICVPIYGVEKYIEQCAKSLFEQSYEHIEYIFVNDCTKDRSIELLQGVIERYPDRKAQIKIINHPYNKGLASSRNTGVDASTGDYLMHVDSDDWLHLDAVKKLVDFNSTQSCDVIVFSSASVYPNETIIKNILIKEKSDYIKQMLLHSMPASIWNKFYRLDFYKESGIRSIDGLNHGEDYVVVPRIIHKANRIMVLDEPLYFYNQMNENSYMKNISSKSIHNLYDAANILTDYFNAVPDKLEYRDVVRNISVRTMLALVKLANKSAYPEISKLFMPNIQNGDFSLSKLDMLLFFLMRKECYSLIEFLLKIYKRLKI